MTVRAVGQNENSNLNTIIKSTAVGTAAGYSLKYLWPVTKPEDNISRRTMINYCRKVTNKSKVAEFTDNGIKTKAQDVFVRMIESKEKDAFSYKNIAKKIAALGGEESVAGKEFRGIIRNVDITSKNMTRKFASAYHFMLKNKRPPAPFIVAGAGLGFLAGFAHNVMKTDVNA